ARKLKRRLLKDILVQSDGFHCLQYFFPGLLLRKFLSAQAESYVLVYGLLEKLVLRVLEHDADKPSQFLQVLAGRIHAIDEHTPFRRPEQPVEMLDQRRFSRACVPYDTYKLAVL